MREKKIGWKAVVLALMMAFNIVCASGVAIKAEETYSADKRVAPVNVETDGYDLVLCIDNSQSADKVKAYYYEALKTVAGLAMGSDIHIAVVFYSGDVNTNGVHNFVDVSTREGYQQLVANLDPGKVQRQNINTNIGSGLGQAHEFFAKSSDPNRKRIVLLLSDGYNNNTAGEQSFRDQADAETKAAVDKLKADEAEIYCVYVDPSIVDASDYLKQIVNYFGDSHYEAERFRSLKTSEIEKLGDVFREIFYNSQNNKKACAIDIDQGGDLFYVPALGVERIVLYIETVTDRVALQKKDGDTVDGAWGNGETFYTIGGPEAGYYNVKVSGDNADAVGGSLAYYAYMEAGFEVLAGKDGIAQLKLHLYDADGKEVYADEAAKVTAAVQTPDSQEDIALTRGEDGILTGSFTMNDYGSYDFTAAVSYEQYINLMFAYSYGKEKHAPVPVSKEDIQEKVIRETDGFHIELFAEDIYQDEDGDALAEIGRLKDAVNVESAVLDGDKILLTIPQDAAFRCAFALTDASGMVSETEVVLGGTVLDKSAEIRRNNIRNAIIAAIIMLILAIFFVVSYAKSKKAKQEAKRKAQYNEGKMLHEAYAELVACQKEARKEMNQKLGALEKEIGYANAAEQKGLLNESDKTMAGFAELIKAVDRNKLPRLLDITNGEERELELWKNFAEAFEQTDYVKCSKAYEAYMQSASAENEAAKKRLEQFAKTASACKERVERLRKLQGK